MKKTLLDICYVAAQRAYKHERSTYQAQRHVFTMGWFGCFLTYYSWKSKGENYWEEMTALLNKLPFLERLDYGWRIKKKYR